jgi:type IV pilus assembly protein PilA
MFPHRARRGISLVPALILASLVLIGVVLSLPMVVEFNPQGFELGTIKSIQTIHQAEIQYRSQFDRYAKTLRELGPPASVGTNASAADLIDRDLSRGEKGGYKFTLSGNASGYVITAVPVKFGSSGSRTFYSDQTMAIRQNFSAEPATANSPEMK